MLTSRERQLLDAIKRSVSVKQAAQSIGMSERTAYNMLYKIRKKYRKARELVNAVLSYRRSDGYLDRLLALKQPLWKEIKEQEKIEKELEGKVDFY